MRVLKRERIEVMNEILIGENIELRVTSFVHSSAPELSRWLLVGNVLKCLEFDTNTITVSKKLFMTAVILKCIIAVASK